MLDLFYSLDAVSGLRDFLERGGPILLWIMGLTFVMWSLIVERIWFFSARFGAISKRAKRAWEARTDHKSWAAHAIRDRLISEVRVETERSIGLIKTLVAVAPLFGLLGTVTGMVEVFDVMAATGSSNARAMASGVSRATLPTMSGLVVSLSGVFLISILDRQAKNNVDQLADELSLT